MKTQLKTIENEQAIILPQAFLEECNITQDAVNLRLEKGRIIIEPIKSKKDRAEKFVNFIMDFCKDENKATLAHLKCADNPQKKSKSELYLAPFYVFNDIDSENEYLVYTTIAAAIAKANVKENGYIGIGRAIARCYDTVETAANKKDIESPAKSKLLRLLACDSVEEVCRVLRPLFSLMESRKISRSIDYISLLRDLDKFHLNQSQEKTKQNWARDFYKRLTEKDGNDE